MDNYKEQYEKCLLLLKQEKNKSAVLKSKLEKALLKISELEKALNESDDECFMRLAQKKG